MNELFKELKKLFDEVENIVKEETNYTMPELLSLDKDKFEENFNKILKRLEKDKKEKEDKDVKVKENGTAFKVYEIENKDRTGICVEGHGKLGEVICIGARGLGEFINSNRNRIKDMDAMVEEVMNAIKSALEEEE